MPEKLLRETELFAGLSDDEYGAVAQLLEPVNLKAGAAVFEQGSDGTELYIMISGRVAIEISMSGAEQRETISMVRNQEVFGELALLDGHRRSATTRALGDVKLMRLQRQALRDLMDHTPRLGFVIMENLAKILAGRLRETNMAMRNLLQTQRSIFGAID